MGGSLTALTLMLKVVPETVLVPSVTSKVKLSVVVSEPSWT